MCDNGPSITITPDHTQRCDFTPRIALENWSSKLTLSLFYCSSALTTNVISDKSEATRWHCLHSMDIYMLAAMTDLEPTISQIAKDELHRRHTAVFAQFTDDVPKLRVGMRCNRALLYGGHAIHFFRDHRQGIPPRYKGRADFSTSLAYFDSFCTFLIVNLGGHSVEYWDSDHWALPRPH